MNDAAVSLESGCDEEERKGELGNGGEVGEKGKEFLDRHSRSLAILELVLSLCARLTGLFGCGSVRGAYSCVGSRRVAEFSDDAEAYSYRREVSK